RLRVREMPAVRTSVVDALEATPRALPASARGQRTRAALLRAGRAVFERDGFVDSRIVDVTAEAGVSVGSFYTHFASREELLAAVLTAVEDDMLRSTVPTEPAGHPYDAVDAANRGYLAAYRRNARMNAVMEQVAAIDPAFMALRRRRADAFVRRNADGIRKLQRRGEADADLDPLLTAEALSYMVSGMANRAFVHGRRVSFERLVQTANRLWANALRLEIPEGR
ncbi:MAG TPA: TetR/AcrR family transcriptional regulator, partial [Baekduia sp.]|nr:TetR/AcrR family transcriptional regulator [Baekduia sp.]